MEISEILSYENFYMEYTLLSYNYLFNTAFCECNL